MTEGLWNLEYRQIALDHLSQNTLLTLVEVHPYLLQRPIYAILSPEIAPRLPYLPIRKVSNIQPLSEKDDLWLKAYWLSHYELDLDAISKKRSFLIDLLFQDSVYAFPESVIISYYLGDL